MKVIYDHKTELFYIEDDSYVLDQDEEIVDINKSQEELKGIQKLINTFLEIQQHLGELHLEALSKQNHIGIFKR